MIFKNPYLSNSFITAIAKGNHAIVDKMLLYSTAELEQTVCAPSAFVVALLVNPHWHQIQLKYCKVPLLRLHLRQHMHIWKYFPFHVRVMSSISVHSP